MSPEEERTWGTLAHVLALPAALVALAFLGPLIVLLIYGNRSPWVRRNAVEALNFQITTLIVVAACIVVGVITLGLGFLLVGPLLLAWGVFWLVVTVLASLAANRGEAYRYPLTIRLVQ